MYRKMLLRKLLLSEALPGAVYVPFIGDGDIADLLYRDRAIYGADIDEGRCNTALTRLPGSTIICADCDGWPFPGLEAEVSVADFDSYSYPYDSFRAFWAEANKAQHLVLFFTDGQRQAVNRTSYWRNPDGSKGHAETSSERRKKFNFWWQYVKAWFEPAINPYRVERYSFYLRGKEMLYWGAVVGK